MTKYSVHFVSRYLPTCADVRQRLCTQVDSSPAYSCIAPTCSGSVIARAMSGQLLRRSFVLMNYLGRYLRMMTDWLVGQSTGW